MNVVSSRLETVSKSLRDKKTRLYYTLAGLPVPPPALIFKVAGSKDVSWFLEGGSQAATSIRSTLKKNGLDVADFESILDFGCGCGRVIRHWQSLEHTEVHGSDYNPELVKWCKKNLSFATFGTNNLEPPLAYEGETFDLIYALSVFTHLPEVIQSPWMAELARVLKPGGYLLVSLHGDYYLPHLQPLDQERYKAGQLVVYGGEHPGTNTCAVFHPFSYVRDTLAKGFDIVDYIPEGAIGNPRQDIYLLRKR